MKGPLSGKSLRLLYRDQCRLERRILFRDDGEGSARAEIAQVSRACARPLSREDAERMLLVASEKGMDA